jgi:hypothetical protein
MPYLRFPLEQPLIRTTDEMKRQTLLFIAILCCAALAKAQEVFVNADFVSSYIWRGTDSGNASVQPSLGINWKGLTVYAWGSTEFREKNNEIALSVEYEYGNLILYANDYFTQTAEEPFKYFNYSSHSTGHTFELGAGYLFSERFPLTVNWYTTFAGNDYRENGKRAWSSYCELSYPFDVKDVNMSVEAGFTPWEGMYSDKFNIVNIGLSATKELKVTSGFSLPIFGKLIANPYEKQLYFVLGFSIRP